MRLPSYQDLSKEQDEINNLPLDGIYLVTGPPGTGKTVMALYRSWMLSKRGRHVRLLMYSRLLSQYTSSAIDALGIDGVVNTLNSWFFGFYQQIYREPPPQIRSYEFDWDRVLERIHGMAPPSNSLPDLLVDEGQDFPEAFYTVARYLSKNLTVFADENQTLTPNNSTIKKIAERLGMDSDDPPHRLGRWNYQTLERNYRNTVEIASLARVFYTGLKTGVPKLPERHGQKPRLVATNTFQQAIDFIARYQQNHTDREIGILLPSRKLQGQVTRALRQRKQRDPNWTNRIENYVGGRGSNADVLDFDSPGIKVVNYKSAKGLEFDTVFIPELQKLRDEPDDTDFKMRFYVLISRARDELYLMYSGIDEPRILSAFPADLVERQASPDEASSASAAPPPDQERPSAPAAPKPRRARPAQPPKRPEPRPAQSPESDVGPVRDPARKAVQDDGSRAMPPKEAAPDRPASTADQERRSVPPKSTSGHDRPAQPPKRPEPRPAQSPESDVGPVRDPARKAVQDDGSGAMPPRVAEPSRAAQAVDRVRRFGRLPLRDGDSGAKPPAISMPAAPSPKTGQEGGSVPVQPKPKLDRPAKPPKGPGRKTTLTAAAEQAGPVVFLTNRHNLLEFLSSGMIVPQGAIPKYYGDLLALMPGRIPLLRGPVDQSLVDVVTSEDATAYPVLLELDPDTIDLSSAAGLTGRALKSLRDHNAQSWAPSGAIPLTAVRQTHFRSQKELDEHVAREYENVPDLIAPTVTPDLFGEGAVQLDELTGLLKTAGPQDGGLVASLDRADRISGARVGAIAAAPANVAILREVMQLVARRAEESPGAPFRKLLRLFARPAGRPSSQPVLPGYFSAALADRRPENPGPDGMLFAAAVNVLSGMDRTSSWRPIEVVQGVESTLEEMNPSAEDAAEFRQSLKAIRGILNNERDFKPFSDKGLISAKALLMVLLRPDVDRLLDWPSDESGADDTVQIAACALAGLLRGRKRMPLTLRPDGLDAYLTSLIVWDLADDGLSDVRIEDSGEATVDEDDNSVWISVGGTEIVRREKPPPALAEVFAGADFGESAVREAAIGICRELEWPDCFSLVVRGTDFAVKGIDQSDDPRIVFPGTAQVSKELDVPRFMERVQSAQPEPELTRRVRERLKLSKSHAPAK